MIRRLQKKSLKCLLSVIKQKRYVEKQVVNDNLLTSRTYLF